MIRRRRAGSDVDMLSVGLILDDSEWHISNETIDTSNDDIEDGDQIYIDVDTVATGMKGVSVTLTFS